MPVDYTALVGPMYFLLIGCELWASRKRKVSLYRINDSINDMSTGILMQLGLMLGVSATVAGYYFIAEHARILDLESTNPLVWVCCFLAVDLAYYWFHRLSHEINFLWAAHVVHHQSEEYNLSVALRQSALQPYFGSVFYWPLALIGFPIEVFLVCSSVGTIYQFWLHTQLINRLGALEAVLVTPSHHRVHHGRNPIYIDRNHGGTFIIWDKLFGTFQAEEEKVVYGITKPLESWNPIWANLHYWADLIQISRQTNSLPDKIRVFVKIPGWLPNDLSGQQFPQPIENVIKFNPDYPKQIDFYAIIQFILLTAMTMGLVYFSASLHEYWNLIIITAVAWGLLNLGGLLECRSWSLISEASRLLILPPMCFFLFSGSVAWALCILFGLSALIFLLRVFPNLENYTHSDGPTPPINKV
jgi:alkylglycerol monooxygenase